MILNIKSTRYSWGTGDGLSLIDAKKDKGVKGIKGIGLTIERLFRSYKGYNKTGNEKI